MITPRHRYGAHLPRWWPVVVIVCSVYAGIAEYALHARAKASRPAPAAVSCNRKDLERMGDALLECKEQLFREKHRTCWLRAGMGSLRP